MIKSAEVLGFVTVLVIVAGGFVVIGSADITTESDEGYSSTAVYVPDNYTKIQWAIDNAIAGETIVVRDGTYIENLEVDKSHLTIKSENGSTYTIVQAKDSVEHVFDVTADFVNISGFTVKNATGLYATEWSSGWSYTAGIYLDNVNLCNISNNNVSNNSNGIYLRSSSNSNITNNIVSNNSNGIYVSGSNNNIINNKASNNSVGIDLSGSYNNNLNNNNILDNTVLDNFNGIDLYYSSKSNISNNIVLNNRVSKKVGEGIRLVQSYDNTIANNAVSNKWNGIELSHRSNGNIITNNNVSNNEGGIELSDSSNNTITNNIASNNRYSGIFLKGPSNNNSITNNILSNDRYGIYLWLSGSNNLSNNIFKNSGISIRGSEPYHYTMHTIEGNTVNGKPIYYYKHASGINVPEDAGEVILANCTNMTVENLNASFGTAGIELAYTTDSEISNSTFANNRGSGIHLYHSHSNTITTCKALNNRDDGIYLDQSNNNSLTNNNVSTNDRSGISLGSSCNTNIVNNNISNNEDGIYLWWDSDNNIVTGNIASNNQRDGVRLEDSSNNTITNNSANSNKHCGIAISPRWYYWWSYNNISNNTALNNGWHGIYLRMEDNCIIANNNASNNRHDGIHLEHSDDNSISSNIAVNNKYDGIHLEHSYGNNISSNRASDNAHDGIGLEYSGTNSITKNIVNTNGRNGIELFFACYNNTVMDNIVNTSINGIYLDDSNDNRIYLNNFVNNTDNVYSVGSTNTWNSTERLTYVYNNTTCTNYLGNYWYDYEGPDDNKDGIGDTPYGIKLEQDRYPLMVPRVNYRKLQEEKIFDTGNSEDPYPSISGTHNGTITPSHTITVQKLYTYPCHGTSGHTEYVRFWNSTLNATATWQGYQTDWRNITFSDTFTLVANKTYNYTIRTGSYPQIHHNQTFTTEYGTLTCTEFTDANGNSYRDWIPAIKLFLL